MAYSPLLVKASVGRTIVEITPERANWTYTGFRAIRLAAGEAESLATGRRELCVVVLCGQIDLVVDGRTYSALGTRDRVFDSLAPAAVYVPAACHVTLRATRAAEIALCSAPSDTRARAVRVLDPGEMRRSTRGQGSNQRHICDILPHTDPTAAHLLVVEVVTPAGHSSSYPPHKHDRHVEGQETQLEETYYHRLDPAQGFAFQRVYTDDRSLDEAIVVEDHDTVMVPYGYHPVVAPHGYDLYYLNVMAGPQRHWVFKNDPRHEWLLKA